MIPQILQSGAILLIVALGGLISERGGILNIGLEGMIGAGAFAAVAVVMAGATAPVAVLVGGLAGVVPALLFALFALRWRANPFIVGLAINVLSAGTLPLLSEIFFDSRGALRIGEHAIGYVPIVIFAVVTVLMTQVFLYRTIPGIRLRITGEQPEWMRAQHLGVRRYQTMGLVAAGALSGFSGALLALRIGVYIPNISSGRGWIALVIVYLGYRRPYGLAVAAVFFGVIEALSVRAQSVLGVPPTLLLSLPYLFTVAAFVSYAAFRQHRRGI
ncbi:MAG: ABC transporter permease [Alkalispirochaeta sp.]|jgi:simple sugar transport system permease protein